MKKIYKLSIALFIFLAIFIFKSNVFAVCTSTEESTLKSEASKVTGSYDIVDVEVTDPDSPLENPYSDEILTTYTRTMFRIYIDNLTENLYVTVTGDDGSTHTLNYSDATNGSLYFDASITSQIVNYTITVYSSSKTDCSDTELYSTSVSTPMYNEFSENMVCEDIEDFYLCQKYLTEDPEISEDEFNSLAANYVAGLTSSDADTTDESTNEEQSESFFQKYKVLIIGIAIILALVIAIVVVIIVKKRRINRKENGTI